jgi:hypothetical protein
MQMTHTGKGPEVYANRESSGSHGGTRPQQEHSPRYHTEGQSYGGGAPQGKTHSRTTPRAYLPTFLDNQPQHNYEDDIEDNFEQYAREYHALSAGFQRKVTLDQYCGIKFRGKPKQYQRPNYELEHRASKIEIPYFDGSTKVTAHAWVQKLDTYLHLNPMRDMDAIKFATIYLDGKAHDWWYHGLTTLGHNQITSYTEFTQRLIDKFDHGDRELPFRELTHLRQTGSPEAYIEEFQRLAVMVQDVSQARLMMLFTEGLMEPLRGWVKAFKPTTLHDAIWKTRDLGSATKTRFTPRPPNQGSRDQRPPMNQGGRDPKGFDRGRGRMHELTRRELRRKQLCFTCKEPWDPTHKCMGKGKAHYIEVISDDEEDEDFVHLQNMEAENPGQAKEEDACHSLTTDEKRTIASISGVPKLNTFRMRGVLQG